MDSEVEGFSETGLTLFMATLGGLAFVILVAAFLTLVFAGRHRMLKGCGVAVGGTVLGTPILIIVAFIATAI